MRIYVSEAGGACNHLGRAIYETGRKGSAGRKGCQIDLLIQARRTICIVEIKRRCEIGREIIEEVDKKVRTIKRQA